MVVVERRATVEKTEKFAETEIGYCNSVIPRVGRYPRSSRRGQNQIIVSSSQGKFEKLIGCLDIHHAM